MPTSNDVRDYIDPATGFRHIEFPNGAAMVLAPDQYTDDDHPTYYTSEDGTVHWGFGPSITSNATNPTGTNDPGTAPTPTQTRADYPAYNRQQVRSAFAPGFELSRLGSGVDDQFIDEILNEGRSGAQTSINNARARGTLSNTGYNAAITGLNNQGTTARTRLQAAADDILGSGRQQLRNVSTAALDAVNSTPRYLSEIIDISPFTTQADDITNQYATGFGGKLRNAIPSDTLFDASELISRGGTAQGPQSSGSALLQSLADRPSGRSGSRRRNPNNNQVF